MNTGSLFRTWALYAEDETMESVDKYMVSEKEEKFGVDENWELEHKIPVSAHLILEGYYPTKDNSPQVHELKKKDKELVENLKLILLKNSEQDFTKEVEFDTRVFGSQESADTKSQPTDLEGLNIEKIFGNDGK